MFAALPLLNLILLTLIVKKVLAKRGYFTGWRQAILMATVLWGVWLTLTTELLSLFQSFGFYFVVIGWLVLTTLCLVITRFFAFELSLIRVPHISVFSASATVGILLIVLVTGLIAVISPPNNGDSLVYHMSRVMHWVQNKSVAHYAAINSSQLHYNPGAEFIIAHLQLLTGSDRLANMVQWGSLVGCTLGVSLIAKQLKAKTEGQILAALITATIPMGILQSVTTQNDYIVAYWLVCFVCFSLLAQQEKSNWFHFLGAAGGLSLAILTKPTAYVFAAPFSLWIGLWFIKHKPKEFWQLVLTMIILLLVVNSGHYYRNTTVYGSPLGADRAGTTPGFEYANQVHSIPHFVSNVTRNLALHINTPFSILKKLTNQSILSLHEALNVDVNDPRTTFGNTKFKLSNFTINENISGNFFHFLLICFSLILVVLWKIKGSHQQLFSYSLCLIGAFLLFAYYLKWQPWHSRLHLSLFVLWTPVIGASLARILPTSISYLVVVILIFQSLPFLVVNPNHKLIGNQNIFTLSRNQQYFLNSPPAILAAYQTAARFVEEAQCNHVGLDAPPGTPEYRIWVVLQQTEYASIYIQPLRIEYKSTVLLPDNINRYAVICLACNPG